MTTRRSRTAEPLPDAPDAPAIGSWGLWLTLVVLATGLAGFAAAALYLHSGQPAWPPPGIDRPGGARAVVGLVAATVAWAVAAVARRFLRQGRDEPVATLLFVALAAAIAAVWTWVRDLTEAGFGPGEHAYTSVYWVLTGSAALMLGMGALMLGAMLLQRLTGVLDPGRMLELDLTHGYLLFAVAGSAVCLALAHLLPDPGGGP